MSMKNKDRCFIGLQGHQFIESYDMLRPFQRKIMRESPFNICAACFYEECEYKNDLESVSILQNFENAIRCEEVT